MYAIEFKGISKHFGRKMIANDLNLQVSNGTFSVIFGEPASGKSTLLRLITGLEKPDQGEIFIRGKQMTKAKPGERNIGYVPQSFALYPHFSVFDNIAYPLKLMGMAKQQVRPIVEEAAARLKISHLLQKKPNQCSGGEKQRVAIARGIVKDTKVFILDDPLTGLDFKLREHLFDDLRQMQVDLDATFIYTTSDPLEALMLAEEIHIFGSGHILESGKIDQVYNLPQHVFTAELLGYPNTNVFPGRVYANGSAPLCRTAPFEFHAEVNTPLSQDDGVYVAVRPQHIRINPSSTNNLITTQAEITLIEDLGGELLVYLRAANTTLEAVVSRKLADVLTEGQAVIGVEPANILVYGMKNEHHIGKGVA